MHTLLRIALLTVSLAIGVAVALAVALREPQDGKVLAAGPTAAERSAVSIDTDQSKTPLSPSDSASSPSVAAISAPVPAVAETRPASPPPPLLVEAPRPDPIARQVGQLEETIQQMEESSQRRERSMLRAIANLQDQIVAVPSLVSYQPAATPVSQPAPPAPSAPAPGLGAQAQPDVLPTPSVHREAGGDKLDISIQNTDIRSVLEMLSQESGLNIVASKSVQGNVVANLKGVDVETALDAVLKSTGFVAQREGNIIYVGTPGDLTLMSQSQDRILTRVYRPNYVRAAEFQALITPMLTPQVGKVTVSSPAEVDIPSDQTKTGGNSFTGADVVVVRDYATVLAEIDQIFCEVDIKPKQVAIEAMILSVKLSDSYKLGVNFAALRDNNNVRLISGTPLANLANIDITEGGLKFGFMDASLSLFIEALEKVGDTNVIAAPRLTCLNKQRAEIQIGEELGYVSTTVTETSATQTVNFLDVGTLLRIRPYIDNDGLIRLEVHPELSTGSVEVQQGLSLPQKAVTQVTTQVLCPDGCTVIIGGLIREDLTTNTTQIPLLGNLPWVGPAFRQKTETVDRNEIIVLITPRIVSEPFMCEEGKKLGNEFTQRQSIYFDKMSPIAKRNLGLHHLRMARAAYAAGDYNTAMKQVNLAIHYDPQSRDAVVLRNEIVAAGGFENESIHEYLHYGLAPLSGRHFDYSKRGFPWKDEDVFGHPAVTGMPDHGNSGPTRTLLRPSAGELESVTTPAPLDAESLPQPPVPTVEAPGATER